MSDDELRRLARAVEARPGDVDARWAYARALARRGDARSEHRELVRLTRGGDRAASAQLDAWAPWPRSHAGGEDSLSLRSHARSLSGPPRRVRSVELRGARTLVGVGRDHVVVRGQDLTVLDLKELTPCWARRDHGGAAPIVVAGETLVATDGRRVECLDLATGERLAEAELPDEVFRLVPRSDGVGLCVYGPTLAALELSPEGFGERLWERPVGLGVRVLECGGPYAAVQARDETIELFEAVSGAPVWLRPAHGFDRLRDPRLLAIDADVLLLFDAGTRSLAAFDPVTRNLQWRAAHQPDTRRETRPALAVVDELVLVKCRDPHDQATGQVLVAVNRSDGRPRWTLEGDASHGVLVPTAELLHLHGRDARGARVVVAHELATGARRFVLDLGVDHAQRPVVAPCHGGLVVLSGDTLRVYTEPTS